MNDQLERWLNTPENERLEFKEAKNNYNSDDALKYFVALANEGGGHLVLGISDTLPHKVIGTQAVPQNQLDEIKERAVNELNIRVHADEIMHLGERVLIFEVLARPTGQPLNFKGQYLMRAGSSLVSMTPDQLKAILTEDAEDWLKQMAIEYIEDEDVVALLHTKKYFSLLDLPYPDTLAGILSSFKNEGLIQRQGTKWGITNMAAILLANDFSKFPSQIARKAPRFIIYKDNTKLVTLEDIQGNMGYAIGFENLARLAHERAPQNRLIEETIREEIKMFPLQALRELIANALIHQDFSISGASVMIEMYTDRVEISNPGKPIIDTDRFIDRYQSRNEQFANIMRRFGVCEEKGSGVDKVIQSVESFQFPAPDFRSDNTRTTVVLFASIKFADMIKRDRIRACYQHCCLRYVSNERMTNTSLRERFHLTDRHVGTISHVITQAEDAGLIKIAANLKSSSSRYVHYVPGWC